MTRPILLAGETFVLSSQAHAGFTTFSAGSYSNGAEPFLGAAKMAGFTIEQLPSERCEREFPRSLEALSIYSAVILSDISALSLLFTPESRKGEVSVNRLRLLRDYVRNGGALMMAGGYTSFQGMDGAARYHGTPLEVCLPVSCLPHADGLEEPEGLEARVAARSHRLAKRLPDVLPPVLGVNRTALITLPDVTLVAEVEYEGVHYPLLAARHYGKGRTLAFTSDIGPHWMSTAFLASPVYLQLVENMLSWLTET